MKKRRLLARISLVLLAAFVLAPALPVSAIDIGDKPNTSYTITKITTRKSHLSANTAFIDEVLQEALQTVSAGGTFHSIGQYGSTISWLSNNVLVVDSSGYVTRASFFTGDENVTLTAYISLNG